VRSSAITSALIAKLLADATLMALVPDGVFKSVAGKSLVTGGNSTRFVIVSPIISTNTRVFNRRAFQEALYLVEARMFAGGNVNDAAARIDELLDPQPPLPPATLTIPGYGLMALYQDEATDDVEVDDTDPSKYWNRAGGRYGVWTQPRAT
jgi:hypothetical protein